MKKLLFLPFLFLLFTGCQDKSSTNGASEMHWDRDLCARCVMVLSDRKNSVQIQTKKPQKTYKFDDLGCMAVWMRENNLDDAKDIKIWVTDVKSGEWIDAKKAFYTSGNTTPMGYGFSAYKSKSEIDKSKKIYTFDEMYKELLK